MPVAPVERGVAHDDLSQCVGQIAKYDDLDPANRKIRRTQEKVFMQVVKNNSGGALLPGQNVKYDVYGLSVGGVAGSTEKADGVVDCFLPAAGVADQKYFLIVVYGPCKFISNGATTLALRDKLVTASSGKVAKQNASPADAAAALVQAEAKCGYCQETVTNADNTSFWGHFRR